MKEILCKRRQSVDFVRNLYFCQFICIIQEWFRRLAEQCCFAGHPKDLKTKAVIPQEAIQMLSVLNAKEVSDIVNHEVGFLQVNTVLHKRGENEFSFSPTSRIPWRPAPFVTSYMVGREDERTNNRTMFPALRNNTVQLQVIRVQ